MAKPNEVLGTCWLCSVAACSAHATRYAEFECAICTPGIAAQLAVTGAPPPTAQTVQPSGESPPAGPLPSPGSATPAATLARLVGQQGSESQQHRAAAALHSIELNHPGALAGPRSITRGSDEPNLVSNLADVMRKSGAPEFVPSVAAGTRFALDGRSAGAISIEAVSAVVRERLSRGPVAISPESHQVLLGALLLGMAVANPESRADSYEATPPTEVEVRLPWEVTLPILLDPVIWMVAVAYLHDE